MSQCTFFAPIRTLEDMRVTSHTLAAPPKWRLEKLSRRNQSALRIVTIRLPRPSKSTCHIVDFFSLSLDLWIPGKINKFTYSTVYMAQSRFQQRHPSGHLISHFDADYNFQCTSSYTHVIKYLGQETRNKGEEEIILSSDICKLPLNE